MSKIHASSVLFLGMRIFIVAAILLGALAIRPVENVRAACGDGLMYAAVRVSSPPNSGAVYQWNQSTSTWSLVAATALQYDAIARDPNNCNDLYLVSNNINAANQHRLDRMDRTTGVLTPIGPTGIPNTPDNADRLSFDAGGTLYALVGATLYTINTGTGAATGAGTVGGSWPGAGSGGDITFAPNGMLFAVRTNTLYAISQNPSPPPTWLAFTLCATITPGGTTGHTGVGIASDGRIVTTEWTSAGGATARLSTIDHQTCAFNSAAPYPFGITPQAASDFTDAAGSFSPTAVELMGFAVVAQGSGILVNWQTASEAGVYGFKIYRTASPDEPPVLISAQTIQAKGTAASGAGYSFIDADFLQPGRTYYYFLQVLALDGDELYGPEAGVANYIAYLPLLRR